MTISRTRSTILLPLAVLGALAGCCPRPIQIRQSYGPRAYANDTACRAGVVADLCPYADALAQAACKHHCAQKKSCVGSIQPTLTPDCAKVNLNPVVNPPAIRWLGTCIASGKCSCGEKPARQASTPGAASAIVLCSPSGQCAAGASCREGVCLTPGQELYLRDTVDMGNDPEHPGCHWIYSDPACANRGAFLEGDICIDELNLKEWTNSVCHAPQGDNTTINCPKYCRDTYGPDYDGYCVPQPRVCEGRNSAACVCVQR